MQIGQAVNMTIKEGVRHSSPEVLSVALSVLVVALVVIWTGFAISIIAAQAKLWVYGIVILGAAGFRIIWSYSRRRIRNRPRQGNRFMDPQLTKMIALVKASSVKGRGRYKTWIRIY